jgi:hypothetical protein
MCVLQIMEWFSKRVDSLKCSICYENYHGSDHLPIVLPCQHTFCSSCIKSVMDRLTFARCPMCRQHVSRRELHINSTLRDILKARKALTTRCSYHDSDCTLFCVDCSQPLCTKCTRGLDEAHKHHKIDELDETMHVGYSNFSELVANAVRCGLCRENYDSSNRVPKVLPCQHTMCGDCTNGLSTCPWCQNSVLPSEIKVNHTIRDMIGEDDQPDLRVYCQYHEGTECTFVCLDCCKPLCTQCMKSCGIHKQHTINHMDDAINDLKKQLNATVEEKMAKFESDSERILNGLMAESAQHTKDVDAVVTSITSTVCAWRERQLEKYQKRVRDALAEHENATKSLRASLEKDAKDAATFPALVEAKKAIEEKKVPIQKEHEINRYVKLNDEALDQLKLMMDYVMQSINTNNKMPEDRIKTNPGETVVEEDLTTRMGVLCLEGTWGGCDPESEEASYNKVPCIIQSASVCPNCNKHTPLFPDRLANLHNPKRNNRFLRVVHDTRKYQQKLLCQTDDFIFVVEMDPTREPCMNFVYGVWEERSREKLGLLRTRKCLLGSPSHTNLIMDTFQHWRRTLFNLRAGCLSQNKNLHGLHL